MLDPLAILPFTRPAAASVRLPGSKSITNRALILAALGEGRTTLRGALFSEDTGIMIRALSELGFAVDSDPGKERICIQGTGGRIPNRSARLFVGNAGTAARFLTALCCLAENGTYEIDGVPQMRKRPMGGLIRALGALGAQIDSDNGHFPLTIRANGLAGGEVQVEASESSQMLSALLMVAPLARHDCTFSFRGVRLPFVRMTARMMEQFGQRDLDFGKVSAGDGVGRLSIPAGVPYGAPGGRYSVEADVTAASYFLTLPVVTGGRVTIENLSSAGKGLQGDATYLDLLEKIGCDIREDEDGATTAEFRGPLPEVPLDVDFSGFSDTFLTLAAITPLLKAPVRIRGIAHTRKQETDRVAAMARELQALGQKVLEKEDSLEITPIPLTVREQIQTMNTYEDHRFAMSFGVLGCRNLGGDGAPWLAIRNPGCCAKTFPDFFRVMESLRQRSHEAPAA